jgi:hypothetical protein
MEKYIGHFGPVSGHTYDMIYDLIFTTERLIGINTRHPMDTSYSFQMTDLLIGRKLAGKGERVLAMSRTKPPQIDYTVADWDDLLNERRHSFALSLSNMKSAEVKRGWFKVRVQIYVATSMKTFNRIRFFAPKKMTADIEALLAEILPHKTAQRSGITFFTRNPDKKREG